MSPRDISYNLNKKEADVVRRLKKMEKCGLVKSEWGSRLGQSVKLYSLTTYDIGIKVDQDGIELKFTKKDKGGNIDSTKGKIKEAQRSIIRPKPVGSSEFFVPLEIEQLRTIVGRNEELEVLKDRTTNFFFIVGIAGIGKTTLVKKFLAESSTTTAKNNIKVFWHTFREIDALAFLLGKISGYLSANNIQDLSLHLDNRTNTFSMNNDRVGSPLYDSSSLDIAADALNKLGSCILVFDDYQKVKDENISVFLKHLRQNFKGKLIIISRSKPPFFLDSVRSKEIVLAGLSFNDAKNMVADSQEALDEEVLRSMWKKFEGHPMALKILCLLIATKKREGSENNRKEKKDFTYTQVPSIEKLRLYFRREILEMLDEDELDTLLTLSIFRNPVRAQALKRKSSSVRSSSKAGGRKSLDYLLHLLEKKLLINRTSNHEFYLHDMLKDILYSMLAYPEEAHSSAAQYYLSEGRADSIIEALYHLTKSHNLSMIFEILEEEVVNERYRFIEEGYAASLVDILRQIRIPNSINKNKLVYLYAIQGKTLSMLEKWDEANERIGEAIKIAKFYSSLPSDNANNNTNNNLVVAYTLRILSESFYLQGDFVAVEKYLLQAAAIIQKCRNTEKVLHDVYMKLARLYFATGRNEESKSYSEMASSLIIH